MTDGNDERERVVAEIASTLKERAKADPRPIREIVERSLEREFATGEAAAVERRIDETRQRIQTLEREINEREREKAAEEDKLARLQQQLEAFETQHTETMDDARDALAGVPEDAGNPAVKNWADKLGLPPTELLERL